MRANIKKLRGHLGFYNISHLTLYECPDFLRDCYSESDKLDTLVSLRFGSIEQGKELTVLEDLIFFSKLAELEMCYNMIDIEKRLVE
jgi:hypothetical protein